MNQPWIEIGWLVSASIAVALILLRKRDGALLAAALVFVAGCLPTLGLSTFATQFFSTTADHYLYWAMLGPAIAAAWVLTVYPCSVLLRSGIVIAIAGWAAMSVHQGGFWKDDFSLLQHTIAVNPNSFLAYNNLGNAYDRQHDAALAAEMFRRAVTTKPDYAMAHSNLGAALHQLGDLDGATSELQRSIAIQRSLPPRLRQTWTTDLNRLGQIFLESGRSSQAVLPFQESLAANSDQPDIVAMLAQIQSRAAHPASTRASSSVTP
jgi:tetratricopeptide (TPR) repeat protein